MVNEPKDVSSANSRGKKKLGNLTNHSALPPVTFNPKSYILNPQPYTLNPIPLHPRNLKMFREDVGSESGCLEGYGQPPRGLS